MNLDDAQREKVAEWIAQGQKLSEIQNRMSAELGLRLTYMEVRMLVDDLNLTPKDVDPPKPLVSPLAAPSAPPAAANPLPAAAGGTAPPLAEEPATKPGGVSLSVDKLARPGAIVSGKVTFSDGKNAEWYLDQTGRLGLAPELAGYRPTPADVQDFQMKLESELSKIGF